MTIGHAWQNLYIIPIAHKYTASFTDTNIQKIYFKVVYQKFSVRLIKRAMKVLWWVDHAIQVLQWRRIWFSSVPADS